MNTEADNNTGETIPLLPAVIPIAESTLGKEVILGIDIAGITEAIKSGYEWLDEMRLVRNLRPSYKPNQSPVTNRVMFIMNALNSIGVKYELDIFDEAGYDLYDYTRPKLVNIVIRFGSRSGKPAIAFCAHHDIANPGSENCQDNSASICNLIHLCAKLKKQAYGENKDLLEERPVIIVFTDKEECGGTGARRMSGRLMRGDFGPFDYLINLELTGLGTELWVDTLNASRRNDDYVMTPLGIKIAETMQDNYHEVSTPFSDAYIFRRCGVDSLCIGILPLEEIQSTMYKETWALCHSPEDTIDKCNADDMSNFTDVLERFVTGKQKPIIADEKKSDEASSEA